MAKLTEEQKKARNEKRKATIEAKKRAEAEAYAIRKREDDLKDAKMRAKRAGEPTRFFEVGQEVAVGNFDKTVVNSIMEDGSVYSVTVTKTETDGHNRSKKITKEEERICAWYELYEDRNADEYPEMIHKEKEYWINSRRTSLNELIRTTNYYFGIDNEPDYQRELVWSEDDKVALIDSIFKDIDIGQFVLIHVGYSLGHNYEILDGKQRLNALCEFFEGRFKYKGLTYAEMHPHDKSHFNNFGIVIGETRDTLTKKQKLDYFLRLNTRGKDQTADHLDRVKRMFEEIPEGE